MTDCCLFVCLRPRTFQRLINDIYVQHRNSRYDEEIHPSESRIRRLVDYATTYPNKLRLITSTLNRMFASSFANGSVGYVLLTVEIYRHMLHQFYHLQLTYLLEPHINFLLLECIQSRKVAYMRAAAVLIKDCVKFHSFTTNLSFLASVLDLCDAMHVDRGSSQENRTFSFIGFTILISLLKVLHHFPSWMETYFDRICGAIHRGIVACGATRYRGGQSTRGRDNAVAALLHSRTLYIQIIKYLPRTLEDLCWKALQSLCATHSLTTIYAVVNFMCLAFERADIKIASKLSIQTLTMITMSYENYSGQEYLLENALLDYAIYRVYEGKGSRQTMASGDISSQDNVQGQHGSASMNQQRQYFFMHMGSEERIRQGKERLAILHDIVDMLQVWRENENVLMGKQRSAAIALESFIYIVRSILQVLAYLIVQYPFLLSIDVFPALEEGTKQSLVAKELLSVRLLPTKLKTMTLSSLSIENNDDGNNTGVNGTDEETLPLSDSPPIILALVTSLHQLVHSLAKACTPLGTNFALLWDQTLFWTKNIEDTRFVGTYHNNKCIAMFRVHALYLCQVLLQNVSLSVPSIQLSTMVSSNTAHGLGQTLVSDQSWDILHRWLVEAGHFEEMRHLLLVIMKLFGAATPAIQQLLHALASKSSSSFSSASAIQKEGNTDEEEDIRVPNFQVMISADAASSRQQFTFFPFSLRQVHFLHSVLFDHMEVTGHGLSAMRVVLWSRWIQMLLRLYGEYEVLLSLPMVLSLLQEAEHVWEDAYADVLTSSQPEDSHPDAAENVAETLRKERLQEQRWEHRQYIRAFVVHYFHLVARIFQIPALFTLLQTWYDQQQQQQQQHNSHDSSATPVFPNTILLDFQRGTLELQSEEFLSNYRLQQLQRQKQVQVAKLPQDPKIEGKVPEDVSSTSEAASMIKEPEISQSPDTTSGEMNAENKTVTVTTEDVNVQTTIGEAAAPQDQPTTSNSNTVKPWLATLVPINTVEIMRKLVAHPRLQPLALHITRAFEQPFVPFSEEYVSDLVETSSVFGARTPKSRSRAASFTSQHSQHPDHIDNTSSSHVDNMLLSNTSTRSRANSRASSVGTAITAQRTPGRILSGTNMVSAPSLSSLIPKSPGPRSVASHHTAHTHRTHHTSMTHATSTHVQKQLHVKTTIHHTSVLGGEGDAQSAIDGSGLAVVETFLSDAHAYPAMTFPYKTRMWKDAFLQGIADMEKFRGVEDVIKYLDDIADEDDVGTLQPQQILFPLVDDIKAKDSMDKETVSASSWLPSLFQRSIG